MAPHGTASHADHMDAGFHSTPSAAELDPQLDELSLTHETDTPEGSSSLIHRNSLDELSPSSEREASTAGQSKWKTALGDVRHVVGGLINHPYESTKHYSILRHSHGIVYYKGSYTNLAITIFADCLVPDDRMLWLQRRGWSGNTGLKAGALLGSKSAWINVTPTEVATASQLPPSDERAWQRDIQKFLEKAPKELRSHQVRETHVLRIPCEAEDGYLRVILCADGKKKKVLCPSPVFRLASTSTSASSIKGASLTTLPLELGIKVGSSVARIAAMNAVAPVVAPVTGVLGAQLAQYQPGYLTQQAATTAYDASGVRRKVDHANQQYDNTRDQPLQPLGPSTYDEFARDDIVGDATGPQSPYPVRFSGKVSHGSGKSQAELGMPTANLDGVPEEVLLRHEGTYFGWGRLMPKDKKPQAEFPDDWLQAIIAVEPDSVTHFQVVRKKTVRVYFIHNFQGTTFFDTKVSVIMMGFLRPHKDLKLGETPDIDAQLFDTYKDIAITQASLSRPEWAVEATLSRVKSAASQRSLTERLIDVRASGQKQVDRVPLHKAGIRTDSMGLRDRLVGNGGIYVPR